MAYLPDADLVWNRRLPKLEMLVTDLEFADNMALLTNNWSDLTAMLDSLSTCCKKLDLSISCKKTKPLTVLPPDDPATRSPVPIHLVIEGEPIEVVSTFSTWAVLCRMTVGWTLDTEINSRVCKASSAFQSLSCILWHQGKIQTSSKVRVFNTVLSLLCTAVSPLWFIVCGSSWGFLSGRRSNTPPYARWPCSRGSLPSLLSALFVSLGTYPGCQRSDYLSRILCLPLLGASILPGDRSVNEAPT